ncbi:MAG: Uncharacterized protein G01um101466_622 [Parcubacteria group bacterium Gr01-1014_66]|nr:MAG: Uncharacterized protein G01um101466_622 [Parcubacteria group bacterium Gr01-1014_66]
MKEETRQCQNCKVAFRIEPEDFAFYEKMKVPAPTFCPECRFQRRLAFFNIFHLYQRPCDLCKKDVISIYPPDARYRIYCTSCWWSDKWDAMDYGRDYDFSRPFFTQFNDLLHEVPLMALKIDAPTLVNSSYNNFAGSLKNSYLLFMADFVENSAYGFYLHHANEVFDSSAIVSSELCYDSMHSYKNSRCTGLRSQVTDSVDCVFLKDSFNCQNCFASANLRNKQYYIFNEQYSKEGYFKEISRWDLGSYKSYQEVKILAEEHWKKFPPKPVQEEFSVNSSGSHVFRSRNCTQCFEVTDAEDSKYLFWLYSPSIKDCYDISAWGENLALSYDCCNVGDDSSGLKFCLATGINMVDAEYSVDSLIGSNIFGCISVRKGEYVILNKRYQKEEYEKLRGKIIAHMKEMPYQDKKGRIYGYGEFFPVELSPHAYNETIAHNFFPLSKEEIAENGYSYREPGIHTHDITLRTADMPDHIRDVSDAVLNEVVQCKKCQRGFKIIPMELAFLRRMNLPLPRECPFCRIEEKFTQWVKDLRLIPRVCILCGIHFETKYTEAEAPTVYCKKCYQAEVV